MSDLTPWFPASVKPVHVGVYQTRLAQDKEWPLHRGTLQMTFLSKWDGCQWLIDNHTVEGAANAISQSFYQQRRWRGLRRKP